MNDTARPPIPAWQQELAASFTRIEELLDFLQLDAGSFSNSDEFPLRVTRSYAKRMEKGNPQDPLLLQVLPQRQETEQHAGFNADPVGDGAALITPGLLHKYQGRVLLIVTGACAIHCRYCFRREFPYAEAQLSRRMENDALAHIRRHPDIQEVILSGGDPLIQDNERLERLLTQLESIPHIKRLRIHSRLPIVLPARIDPALLDRLCSSRLQTVMVVHANHGNEIDAEVRACLRRIHQAGITLLNQSVLLRGINDTQSALIGLSEALFEAGALPYYLHLLDRARGTAHFEVSETTALALLDGMRKQLSGYLVPRLVRETAGAPYKTPVEGKAPNRLE